MRVPHLLAISLLILVCVAPVLAQSPQDNIPGSFFSEPLGALPPDAQANLRLNPIQRPIEIDRLYFPSAKPEAARAGEHDWAFKPWPQSHKRVLARNDATCYSIRSYRVKRDDPESDSTRPAGYSTCQPAGRFQVKETVDSQRIVPRFDVPLEPGH
jgi:hypothetical protein